MVLASPPNVSVNVPLSPGAGTGWKMPPLPSVDSMKNDQAETGMPDQLTVRMRFLPFGVAQAVTSNVRFGFAAAAIPDAAKTVAIASVRLAATARIRRTFGRLDIVH